MELFGLVMGYQYICIYTYICYMYIYITYIYYIHIYISYIIYIYSGIPYQVLHFYKDRYIMIYLNISE